VYCANYVDNLGEQTPTQDTLNGNLPLRAMKARQLVDCLLNIMPNVDSMPLVKLRLIMAET
jgi:hypothetical protein